MLANPNETFATLHKSAVFALSGELATFYIPTVDPEQVTTFGEVLNDLIRPTEGEFGKIEDEDITILTVKVQNTQNVDRINEALARTSEHFNLPEVIWTSAVAHRAVPAQVGVLA